MKDEITELNGEVEKLSSKLSKEWKAYLRQGQEHALAEGKLHEQTVEDKTLIGSINAELKDEDAVDKELKKLTKIHDHLQVQAEKAAKAEKKSEDLLDKAREESRQEQGKHRSLRHQIVKMNNYSLACHANVEKASKKLGLATLEETKDSQAAEMTSRQKKKAGAATEQRLLAKHAVLVSEIKKAEEESVEGVQHIQDMQKDLSVLQQSIIKQVLKSQEELRQMRKKMKTEYADLLSNTQAMSESNEQKEAMDLRLQRIMKELRENENPITIARFEGENEALSQELQEGFDLYSSSKENETRAQLNVEQANSTANAQQAALDTAEQALSDARAEAVKKVTEAAEKAAESKKAANEQYEQAKAAIAERCKSEWDPIQETKDKELDECKQTEQDLEMEQAKEESLKATLAAKSQTS
jgi:hypothetical protein